MLNLSAFLALVKIICCNFAETHTTNCSKNRYYVKKYTHSNVYGCCRHVCAMQCRSSLFDRNGYDRQ